MTLTAIDVPQAKWASPLAAFEAALQHEGLITARINKLADLAVQESDHATHTLLQWFITEQVEEESTADTIVQQLKLVSGSPDGLFMVDRELAKRVFTPPPANAAAGGAA